ncbi:LysR family transcriptional regulator [Pigmentiphaga litoralis]|jgi:DNA-binding transcriptional LysR family regulator|uniref:LysR family transcriptional regulator n=1 Tax=Pigmentiphaga litoralis TaxID=516702 RepID=UPI0016772D45|nr:LysR family transcriptional regulator [Pigmentiphaga litoralis]GGX25134.1 LysR family transcriptional regulator [Pigmentiphaga litoralis]
MDSTDDMQLFVTVADRGSFAAAAAVHHLTPSAIGKRITQLEARLNVTLIERTTRKLLITPEGRHYLDRARVLLHDLRALEHGVRHLSNAPEGEVSLSCHAGIAERFILPMLPDFLTRHPKVHVKMMLGDHVETAESDGADVIIRAAGAPLPNYISRKLGDNPWVLCATAGYLDTHGTPAHPRDLTRHNCLSVGPSGATRDKWLFEVDGKIEPIAVAGNFGGFANAVYAITRAGVGIGRLPDFLVRDDLASGALRRVLPRHMVADPRAVYLFYRSVDPTPSRLHMLVEYLGQHLTRKLEKP